MPLILLLINLIVQDTDLAKPTGQYQVAAISFNWIDQSRDEKATTDPSDKRRILCKAYYPTNETSGKRSSYYDYPDAYKTLWEKSEIDLIKRVRTNAIANGKLVQQKNGFPLILLSHGWQGSHASLTMICEELASHGYVVAAVDHPFMGNIAFSADYVTETTEDQFKSYEEVRSFYGADLNFVIFQLKTVTKQSDANLSNGIDFNQIIAAGHSSGFLAARGLATLNQTIDCIINIDAPGIEDSELAGYRTRILNIRTEHLNALDADFLKQHQNIKEVYIANAKHGSISDWDFLFAKTNEEKAHSLALIRAIAQEILKVLN